MTTPSSISIGTTLPAYLRTTRPPSGPSSTPSQPVFTTPTQAPSTTPFVTSTEQPSTPYVTSTTFRTSTVGGPTPFVSSTQPPFRTSTTDAYYTPYISSTEGFTTPPVWTPSVHQFTTSPYVSTPPAPPGPSTTGEMRNLSCGHSF